MIVIKSLSAQVEPFVRMKKPTALILLLWVIAKVVHIKMKLGIIVQSHVEYVKKVRLLDCDHINLVDCNKIVTTYTVRLSI